MSRALDVVTLTGEEYDAMIERIATMHEALRGIAAADWREWQELASAEEFVRWAKSRALHALTPNGEAHRKDAAGGLSGGADCSAAT